MKELGKPASSQFATEFPTDELHVCYIFIMANLAQMKGEGPFACLVAQEECSHHSREERSNMIEGYRRGSLLIGRSEAQAGASVFVVV